MSETATTARPSLDFGEALRKYSIVLILLAFVIVVSIITEGRFLQTQNLLNVVVQVAPIGIIGLGMMAAIITKGIDLSVGSTVALCAIVSASLAQVPGPSAFFPNLPSLPIALAVVAGLAMGTLVGAVVGSLIAVFRIPPFVATLGMMTAARGFANIYNDGRPISNTAPKFNELGEGVMPILLLAFVAIVMWLVLNRTRFGRHVYAIGATRWPRRSPASRCRRRSSRSTP